MSDSLLQAFEPKGGASEAMHAAEADLASRVEARRNRKLAEWAAGLLGLTDDAVRLYLVAIIAADLSGAGPEPVGTLLLSEFASRGVAMGEADLRARLAALEAEARLEVAREGGAAHG